MGIVARNAVAVLAGAALLAGSTVVGVRALEGPHEVKLAAESSTPSPRPERGVVRGEALVARRGSFETVRFDRGILVRLDVATLVVREADGTVARFATTSSTRVRRDGQPASVGDLRPGDHVAVVRLHEGEAWVTRFVRAFSPEAWAARGARRTAPSPSP